MDPLTEKSYRACRQVCRQARSHFGPALWLLPAPKRRAMHSLYAFMRHADDAADMPGSVEDRRQALQTLGQELEAALRGRGAHPCSPALVHTLRQYQIPAIYLHAVLEGMHRDLSPAPFETFAELEEYCYRVATVVGKSCLHIWGVRQPQAFRMAHDCGMAFQLTNILRDLKEDAERGRCYLPREDLRRFQYSEHDLRQGRASPAFFALMEFELTRVEDYYQRAREILPLLHPDGQRVFRVMLATYGGLLRRIRALQGNVFLRRIRLSRWQALGILARFGYGTSCPSLVAPGEARG